MSATMQPTCSASETLLAAHRNAIQQAQLFADKLQEDRAKGDDAAAAHTLALLTSARGFASGVFFALDLLDSQDA